jgi:hypothetical protein
MLWRASSPAHAFGSTTVKVGSQEFLAPGGLLTFLIDR